MNEEEMRQKILTDPRFVNGKRFDYDLRKVEAKFPEVVPDHIIADLLMIPEAQITEEYEVIVRTMRGQMGAGQ